MLRSTSASTRREGRGPIYFSFTVCVHSTGGVSSSIFAVAQHRTVRRRIRMEAGDLEVIRSRILRNNRKAMSDWSDLKSDSRDVRRRVYSTTGKTPTDVPPSSLTYYRQAPQTQCTSSLHSSLLLRKSNCCYCDTRSLMSSCNTSPHSIPHP